MGKVEYLHTEIDIKDDLEKVLKTTLILKCRFCPQLFKKASELIAHELTHTQQIFPSLHKKVITKPPPTKVQVTVTGSALNKFISCDICNQPFITLTELRNHKRSHSVKQPPTVECNICGKKFTQNGSLKRHCLTHIGKRPYKCDLCALGFLQASDLKRHLMVHNGEKPYVCDFCGKSFGKREHLKLHRYIHTGDKPYKCTKCTRAFSRPQNLKIHLKCCKH